MEDAAVSTNRLWIITGAAGFLGSTLVRELLSRGETVRALVHGTKPQPSLDEFDCEIVPIDVTDESTLTTPFEVSDSVESIVVHCAGIVSIASRVSDEVRQVNVEGTRNVLSACKRAGVSRLVYVSSVHAITEPSPPRTITEIDDASGFDPDAVAGEYAKTKAAATKLVLESDGLDYVIVHPSGMIGPNDFGGSHTAVMIRDAATGNLNAIVAGGYDFVDVRDVANGIIAAALRAPRGRAYLLTGHYTSITDLVQPVAELSGRRTNFRVLPLWLARLFAPIAEFQARVNGTKPTFTSYSLRTLQAPSDFSHTRATTELDYHPRELRETLADTVTWLLRDAGFPNE